MFCDLVGSTALSARMDPEDLREVISAYQKCVAAALRRFCCEVHGRRRKSPDDDIASWRAFMDEMLPSEGTCEPGASFRRPAQGRPACLIHTATRALGEPSTSWIVRSNATPMLLRKGVVGQRLLECCLHEFKPPWSGATPRRGSDQTDAASICAGSLEGSRDPLHVGNWSPCYLSCFGAACSGNLCCKRTK